MDLLLINNSRPTSRTDPIMLKPTCTVLVSVVLWVWISRTERKTVWPWICVHAGIQVPMGAVKWMYREKKNLVSSFWQTEAKGVCRFFLNLGKKKRLGSELKATPNCCNKSSRGFYYKQMEGRVLGFTEDGVPVAKLISPFQLSLCAALQMTCLFPGSLT